MIKPHTFTATLPTDHANHGRIVKGLEEFLKQFVHKDATVTVTGKAEAEPETQTTITKEDKKADDVSGVAPMKPLGHIPPAEDSK